MRAPVSWLREYAAIPAEMTGRQLADQLIRVGLEVESVDVLGDGLTGPLVVGRVDEITELTGFKKPIRFCRVDVGSEHGPADGGLTRGIVCGARNFSEGDYVVVALPGAMLPGDFQIAARTTYDHVSDGMICSESELGLGSDHDGIIVLASGDADAREQDISIGDDATFILGIGEEVLDIAVTPDRGYCLSIRGIAREAAAALNVEFRDPAVDHEPYTEERGPEVLVEDAQACPLFTLGELVDFDVHARTPRWMRHRLIACGMRSVSLAVDVTNYVMLELGQPLHAFDADLIAERIVVRRAVPGETLETLDHVERDLGADDLCITDGTGPIGLAGVIGGLTTEVNDDTTRLWLEAAHFEAVPIARMSRTHKVSTEASRRFERGVDPDLPLAASARAADLLHRLGGARMQGQTVVRDRPIESRVVIPLDVRYPAELSGAEIDADTVLRTLTQIGCSVQPGVEPEQLEVFVPSWRPDLRHPVDLVEEVVRLYGYDRIPSRLPSASAGYGLTQRQRLLRRISRALAGAGLTEVLTYPFVGVADLDALNLPTDDPRRDVTTLANPLSDEQPGLRPLVLPGLLSAAARNVGRGRESLALFEVGAVFGPLPSSSAAVPRPEVTTAIDDDERRSLEDLLPGQPTHAAWVMAGSRTPQGWWGQPEPWQWSDAVAIVETIAEALHLRVERAPGDDSIWHPGRAAAIIHDGVVIGTAGELHPRVCAAAGLPARTVAGEVDLIPLIAAADDAVSAPVVGTHPLAKEDLALVVPDSVPAEQVRAAIIAGGGELVESVRLFDVYSGPQVPAGHRSLAFSLRLRAPDRTLTDVELAQVREAAIARAEADCGAVLRS